MNVLEMLAYPLSHGVDFGAVARGTASGGQKTDIEWCLVGLSPFQEHLIRAKYQLDQQARHAAWSMWFIRLMEFGWQTDRPHVVEHLATDTLAYWMSPKTCKVCEGVGEVMIDAKVVTCEACKGSGRRDRKPYSIGRALGYTDSQAPGEWVKRHKTALDMLDIQESAAAIHMIRRFKPRY